MIHGNITPQPFRSKQWAPAQQLVDDGDGFGPGQRLIRPKHAVAISIHDARSLDLCDRFLRPMPAVSGKRPPALAPGASTSRRLTMLAISARVIASSGLKVLSAYPCIYAW